MTVAMHLDWLEEDAGDVVVVGGELLEDGLLLKAEEVNVVVHSGERVRFLVTVGRRHETQVRDKETLLGSQLGCARIELCLLEEAVHGGSHVVERLGFGQVDGSEADRRARVQSHRHCLAGVIKEVDKHNLLLVVLLLGLFFEGRRGGR